MEPGEPGQPPQPPQRPGLGASAMAEQSKASPADVARRMYFRYEPFEIRKGEGRAVDDSYHLYMVLVFEHDEDLAAFRKQYGLPHEIFQDARLVKARLDPAYVAPRKLPKPPEMTGKLARRIGPDPSIADDLRHFLGDEGVRAISSNVSDDELSPVARAIVDDSYDEEGDEGEEGEDD